MKAYFEMKRTPDTGLIAQPGGLGMLEMLSLLSWLEN
jgi:hypothetical protein